MESLIVTRLNKQWREIANEDCPWPLDLGGMPPAPDACDQHVCPRACRASAADQRSGAPGANLPYCDCGGAHLNAARRVDMSAASARASESIGRGAGSATLDQVRQAASRDEIAAGLVELAQGGDQLAGRVLLQALLPKLIGIAARHGDQPIDDYISSAWLRISTFPIQSRRNAVLTNLALDTLKMVTRSRRTREVPTDTPPELPRAASTEPRATDLIAQSLALRLVSAQTADVLRSVYSEGLSGKEAAQRHGLSETTIRYRCSSATQRMRANAELLLAA